MVDEFPPLQTSQTSQTSQVQILCVFSWSALKQYPGGPGGSLGVEAVCEATYLEGLQINSYTFASTYIDL